MKNFGDIKMHGATIQKKCTKYVRFHWPPVEAALSILK
jgi:hypothetical protein